MKKLVAALALHGGRASSPAPRREHEAVVALSMVLVAVTGVLVSGRLDWGFFRVFWLGAVQAIMGVALCIMFSILRPYYRAGGLMRALPPGPGEATDEIRAALARLDPWIYAMRAGALVAFALAIWKPSL